MEGVARKYQSNSANTIIHGYVTVPKRVDRDKFVQTCMNKESVHILGEDGLGVFKNCKVSKSILPYIEFPADDKSLGSLVVMVNDRFKNNPVVIGVLSKSSDTALLTEYVFELKKKYGNNSVSISGDAKEGVLNLNVTDLENEAVLNINVVGKTGSKVNITSQTETSVYSDEKVSIRSGKEVVLTVTDPETKEESFISMKDGEIILSPNSKTKVGGGAEPIPLGETLKNQLDLMNQNLELIYTAIQNGVTVNGDGGASFKATMLTILAAKQNVDLSSINSKKSFTD